MTEDAVEGLLRELCVDLGFCLPPDACDQLVEAPPLAAEEFARRVFQADGLDFDTYDQPGVRDAVVATVARHMTAA
ncbi:MAG: hypothetical protein JHC81_03810 [Brevundimonas sp.]|uniref:hypothetical protein n=1 Tax=Brevundimonas sp. TaxID=1871086 RepID=UPI001A2AAE50|nr:hypothetical protein [Brevundimonas sp.]MBJ7446639.1 hypothetical protein [Brevundimonas sp.]